MFSAHIKHRKLFEFSLTGNVANMNICIEILLASLENEARTANIKELQWPYDDDIFKLISMQSFIEKGEQILSKLTIHIVPCVKIVIDSEEKQEILAKFHNDPLFGGHAGQNRLYAKSILLEKHEKRYCEICQ